MEEKRDALSLQEQLLVELVEYSKRTSRNTGFVAFVLGLYLSLGVLLVLLNAGS